MKKVQKSTVKITNLIIIKCYSQIRKIIKMTLKITENFQTLISEYQVSRQSSLTKNKSDKSLNMYIFHLST
jgi:hypothetical protein